jgi:hypothetical protein
MVWSLTCLFAIFCSALAKFLEEVTEMKRCSASVLCVLFAFLTACSPEQNEPRTPAGVISTGPLPDTAYKASISIVNAPQTMHAGEQASVDVKVKNVGNGTWPSQGQGPKYKVELGNHWLDAKGAETIGDDGRAGLPHDLKAGDEAELLMTVKAPKTPGDYTLEFDMVHEDVTWFKDRGSQTTKVNVKVQ